MKVPIVAGGESNVPVDPELEAKLRELRADIEARYAAQLAVAGFLGRIVLHWRMAAEFRRERGKFPPSAYALYSNRIAAKEE